MPRFTPETAVIITGLIINQAGFPDSGPMTLRSCSLIN